MPTPADISDSGIPPALIVLLQYEIHGEERPHEHARAHRWARDRRDRNEHRGALHGERHALEPGAGGPSGSGPAETRITAALEVRLIKRPGAARPRRRRGWRGRGRA